MTSGIPESSSSSTKVSPTKENMGMPDMSNKHEPITADLPENSSGITEDDKLKKNALKSKFTESKTFDALMRSDINLEEANDERGNFQSVMITPNIGLRQMHQNIVTSKTDPGSRNQNRNTGLLQLIPGQASGKFNDRLVRNSLLFFKIMHVKMKTNPLHFL